MPGAANHYRWFLRCGALSSLSCPTNQTDQIDQGNQIDQVPAARRETVSDMLAILVGLIHAGLRLNLSRTSRSDPFGLS